MLMTRKDDIRDPYPVTGRSKLPDAARPDTATQADDGRAAARETEVCQKIEIEIAFRHRLFAALDMQGYIVKFAGTMTGERASVVLREKFENEPAQTSNLWTMFFVHSKDASAAFSLSVWFSSDVPTPSTFKWRPLDGDDLSVAGPSQRKVWDGESWRDNTPPLCYHVSIIDARLRFEALPLPVMRKALLGDHLAEELASKVAVAFERICALHAD